MLSQRPYLIRAFHAWISDSGATPHILVDAEFPGLEMPLDSAEDGKIVLNISWSATADLELGNEEITCSARFAGVAHELRIPVDAVLFIFAKENGLGMGFGHDGDTPPPQNDPDPEPEPPRPDRSHLKVVK